MARVMGIVTSAAGSCHQPFPRARQPPPQRVRGHPNVPRRVPVAAPSAFSGTRGLREERGVGCRAGGLGRRTRPQPAPQPRVRREGPREPTSRHASADRGPNVSRRPHARVRPAAEAWCPEPPPPSPSPHISVPPRWREDTWQRDIPPQTNKQTHGVYDPRHTAWAEEALRRRSWLWDDEARPGLRRLVRADGSGS